MDLGDIKGVCRDYQPTGKAGGGNRSQQYRHHADATSQ